MYIISHFVRNDKIDTIQKKRDYHHPTMKKSDKNLDAKNALTIATKNHIAQE